MSEQNTKELRGTPLVLGDPLHLAGVLAEVVLPPPIKRTSEDPPNLGYPPLHKTHKTTPGKTGYPQTTTTTNRKPKSPHAPQSHQRAPTEYILDCILHTLEPSFTLNKFTFISVILKWV